MELEDLIVDDAEGGVFRVHRSTMTSPELLELEQKRIIDKCWLYVGHDSEVERSGDYVRRTVAGRPVFLVRGRDGEVRVFLNTCTHRGSLVCRQDEGQAESFQCFYHGWTFNNQGELIGIPDQDAYGPGFDRTERALKTPSRFDSYRGMYFVSFNPDIESLADYLGGMRRFMDLTMDSAEVLGGWAVARGISKYTLKANWKLLVENSIDAYHVATVHATYTEYITGRVASLGAPPLVRRYEKGLELTHGHGGFLNSTPGRTIANWSPLWSEEAKVEVDRLRGLLAERYGEERMREMAEISRYLFIYPNLIFHDLGNGFRFRQIWPVAPDRMQVLQWELVPREERDFMRAYRLESAITFNGPGGFSAPDDVEALESCQRGFGAIEAEWSDLSRGMHREAMSRDELQTRAFWRQWQSLMLGHTGAAQTADTPPSTHGAAAA